MTKRHCIITLIIVLCAGNSVQGQLVSITPLDIKSSDHYRALSDDDTASFSFLNNLRFNEITYLSDSLNIKGFIVAPTSGVSIPVIIFNRGGNREFGKIDEAMLIDWLAPIANAGYIVIASQYREGGGSEGRDEYGGRDVNDILNLIPVIDSLHMADASRIGMYGWSRGGMMTYLALTRTSRIKAAIIGGAPTDLLSTLSQRPELDHVFRDLIPDYAMNKIGALRERSALYWPEHIAANTKLLIVHGKNDERADYRQAEMMVLKLLALNRAVQLKIFDEGDHSLRKIRKDKDQLIATWLKSNL